MPALFAFASGLVFGIGLLVCGLANPAKVLAFLDLAGAWDPSLLVVMGVGVCVAAIAFAVAQRRNATLLGEALRLQTSREVDRRLVLGSLVFGLGWGLAGLCPGPALVLLGTGRPPGVVFVLAMLAGMGAFEIAERLRAQRAAAV
ncbi:MAG TPA: DUF6691 family protein [Casimicrobiaceae bacterium]|nr:DUF6691 family protein [Casimicrobiaceae bacterium]